VMKRILDNINIAYQEEMDEAAFYGPKLDIQFKNVFGKEDTLFRAKIDTLNAWEFMSLNGVVLTAFDLEQERERTVLAYYSYHVNIK